MNKSKITVLEQQEQKRIDLGKKKKLLVNVLLGVSVHADTCVMCSLEKPAAGRGASVTANELGLSVSVGAERTLSPAWSQSLSCH